MNALWAVAKFLAIVSILGGVFTVWLLWKFGPLSDEDEDENRHNPRPDPRKNKSTNHKNP